MMCFILGKSSPFDAMSVATNTSFLDPRYSRTAHWRSSWSINRKPHPHQWGAWSDWEVPFPPWMLTAWTPFNKRYSWMSSTSAFFSEKISTCESLWRLWIMEGHFIGWIFSSMGIVTFLYRRRFYCVSVMMSTHRGRSFLQTLKQVDNLCFLFDILHFLYDIKTCCTCSANIHCHYNDETNRDIQICSMSGWPQSLPGFTRALLAKFCIFFGIVALKSNVCLWDLK